VISRALPPPRSAPTDTGVCFIVGATSNTDTPYALVHSLTEFVDTFGARGTGTEQTTYDAADVYFREGGSQCYIGSTTAVGTLAAAADASDSASTSKSKASAAPLALDTGIATALAALIKQLGPGQILIADPVLAADPANQSALLAHAAACNRVALLSLADGDATALSTAATALQTDVNARYGAVFMPSAEVPGVTPGTTRTVPYTAIEAGIIARNDLAYTANQPAAGDLGQSVFALSLLGAYSDADYASLNDDGVNMARIVYGGVRTYGYRTIVDTSVDTTWENFGWARLNMEIVAQAEAIGEHYVFSQLDGRRRTIASFGGDLAAMLGPYYDLGALYGTAPADAYDVNVGVQVNTEATIANGELHAILSVRMSGMAEWVVIEIVKVATDQSLPVAA
jgi:phage tail sheath protein FI